MEFKIEKGVPLPAIISTGRGARAKYPFELLEVGESFYIAGKTKIASTLSSASARTGRKFVSAVEGEGVRVWRVEGETEIKPRKPRKPKAAAVAAAVPAEPIATPESVPLPA